MSRRGRTLVLWLAAAAGLGWAPPARAGGPLWLERDPAADRIERRWRAHPAAALPEIVKAACGEGKLHDTAREILRDLGPRAIEPLLATAARTGCESAGFQTLAELLCIAQGQGREGHLTPAFGPLRAALGSGDRKRVAAALAVIDWIGDRPPDTPAGRFTHREESECRAADTDMLLAASAAPLGRLLATTAGPRRREAVETAAMLGRHAAPMTGAFVRLLADEDAKYEAVTALSAVGPTAAPAAPALGRLLEATDNEWRRFTIAYALGQIGPPAAVALPALRARLAQAAATPCASALAFPWYLRAALAIGPAPGETTDAWRTQTADGIRADLASLRRCDAADGERDTIEVLATLPPELSTAPLVEVMLDEGRSVRRRGAAAKALETRRTSLSPAQAAIEALLLARTQRPSGGGWRGAEQQVPTIRSRAYENGMALWGALQRCDQEGDHPARKLSPASELPDGDEEMTSCLGARLCGPGPEPRRRALAVCCRYAYGAGAPAWCAP